MRDLCVNALPPGFTNKNGARQEPRFLVVALPGQEQRYNEPRSTNLANKLDQAATAAFTCLTIAAKAALSNTAMSASTLRSSSIEAFFRPLMNTLYVMSC